MMRVLQLGGWFAATNALIMVATMTLAGGEPRITSGLRAFAAWCGIG